MNTITEPTIIPLTDEPEIQNYLNRFGNAIAERPEAFATLLETLGEAATRETLDLRAEERAALPISISDEELITNFFKYRYDRESEFDEATEDAMATDPVYKDLLERHLNTHSINSQVGPMKHEVVANPKAEDVRNATRRARLAFFIARTLQYQRQPHPVRLSSAV